MIKEVYKQMLPEDMFAHFKGRVDGFQAAYGTVLFYEDTTRLREFQEKYKVSLQSLAVEIAEADLKTGLRGQISPMYVTRSAPLP